MKKENWEKDLETQAIYGKNVRKDILVLPLSWVKYFTRQLLEKQKQGIIKEIEEDLDAGMFI